MGTVKRHFGRVRICLRDTFLYALLSGRIELAQKAGMGRLKEDGENEKKVKVKGERSLQADGTVEKGKMNGSENRDSKRME